MVGGGKCRSTFKVFSKDWIMNFHAFAGDLKIPQRISEDLKGFDYPSSSLTILFV